MRTPKFAILVLTLALAITLLAVAACGGGDDNKSSATAAPAGSSQTSSSGSRTGAAGTNGATNQSTEQPANTDDPLAQLQAFGKDIKQVTGKVTYQSTNADPGGTPSTSTITLYSKDNKSRFDSVDSDGSTSSYITTPDTTYSCSASEQTCISIPNTSAGAGGLGLFGGLFSGAAIDALVSAAEAKGVKVTKSSESVAGTDATCYSGDDNGDKGKFCFNDAGLMLLTQSTSADGTTFELRATSFSSDVSDSDFNPPYPVTTIPAIATPG